MGQYQRRTSPVQAVPFEVEAPEHRRRRRERIEGAEDVVADAGQRKNPLGGFKPSGGANAGVEILGELGAVNRIVAEKASPEDAAAMREWLLEAAQEAANAAKEGGFLGFHAERVSEGEQRMLDSLRDVLSAE